MSAVIGLILRRYVHRSMVRYSKVGRALTLLFYTDELFPLAHPLIDPIRTYIVIADLIPAISREVWRMVSHRRTHS